MEIVSVSKGVGEVLTSPQTTTPPIFQPQHHGLRACMQHEETERVEDDEFEDDLHMETEDEPQEDLFSGSPRPPGDRSCLEDDSGEDQMDFDDAAARTSSSFLEDDLEEEEDSSSRVFPSAPPSTSPPPNSSVGGGRRNKRKNFQPRNIVYFPDSEEDDFEDDVEVEDGGIDGEGDTPLDLSEVPLRRSLLPRRRFEDDPSSSSDQVASGLLGATSLADHTMRVRRFLNLYGLQENFSAGVPSGAALLSGKILETLKANGGDPNSLQRDCAGGSCNSTNDTSSQEEPPTPPHTPQRDFSQVISASGHDGASRHLHHSLESAQQALHARLLGERNFSTLLTLAALQEGSNAGAGVPLPPTLDPNKSIPTTPTTPTSTAVTPGLASLSLQNGGSTPPTMVHGIGGVRDQINKHPVDYSRYVKRYLSSLECGVPVCRELNHREHFHCLDCDSKVFSKKEEMIRHFKWHKKRDESLQHGFMRYSPTDDCSDRFANCSHNRKQTHYHCLKVDGPPKRKYRCNGSDVKRHQESCDKVYISTSDVQMHANYHRKDSAIMQEGFQRFRASEDCNHMSCSFSGQRTTHFHCIRGNCNFTFKNKADMEKHKTYHIKDEQLTKDGFKKFMKQEDCGYESCKLSKVANHIHCIRPECNYVLHSSGQIFAHKLACISNHQRKHERQEHEKAYRKYKLAQTMLGVSEPHPALNPLLHEALRPLGGLGGPMIGPFGGGVSGGGTGEEPASPLGAGGTQGPSILPAHPGLPRTGHPPFLMGGFPTQGLADGQHPLARLLGVPPPAAHSLFPGGATSANSTPTSSSGPASPVDLTVGVNALEDREWERFVRYYARDDDCRGACELAGIEHWHCDECETLFHTRETAKEHGRAHERQVAITEENYTRVVPGESSQSCSSDCQIQDQAEHFHCNWDGCGEAVLASGDKPFRRLEHFRIHDFARRLPAGVGAGAMGVGVASVTSVDAMFKRKRGRPPKNRIIEVWNEYLPVSSSHDSPQAIFTSFKLPKSSPPPPIISGPGVPANPLMGLIPPGISPLGHLAHMGRDIVTSTPGIPSGSTLGVGLPPPLPLTASKVANMLPLSKPVLINPPQPQVELVDGFYVWAEGTLCSDQLCPHIGRRHFHCAHPRCIYVTLNAENLSSHTLDFHDDNPISDGFMCFDRFVNCRMGLCPSNNVSKHFHCTKCGFSFVRYDIMESHAEKHQQEDDEQSSHSLGPLSPIYLQKPRPDSPISTPTSNSLVSSEGSETPSKSQLVKSSGIFYPLSPFPSASQGGATRATPSTTNSEPGAVITPIPPSSRTCAIPTFTLPVSGCLSITATRRSPGPPPPYSPAPQEVMDQDETDDSKKKISPSLGIEPSEHSNEQGRMADSPVAGTLMSPERTGPSKLIPEYAYSNHHLQYGQDISCGRPFCKLKKKEHFHCQICNQAFSEQEKLKPHILKHMSGFGGQINPSEIEIEEEEDVDIKQEGSQETHEEKKYTNDEIIGDHTPFSPQSTTSSIGSQISSSQIPGLSSSTSPRASLSCHQPPPQFPNPLIYSQAASFHGLPNPFGPHFGISGMFPGSIPRLLPPAHWPGVHPALAAMTHPHLMLPQVRPNGELPHGPQPGGGQCSLSNMSSVVGGGSGMTPSGDRSPIIPNSLNTSPHLALLGKRLGPDDFNMQEAKKIRASHSIRMLKDEPVPEGYIRFRFNEDCQYPHCGYREHQTHFHCMRKDCGYSFCDKTRFVQHTARHERLDTLMGGDFHQYRSNVPCGRPECVYSSMIGQQQNKASHFHCLKCDFVCTDTNKVVAHRRQHQKRDSINAAGFEKFTPSQPCGIQSCSHNQKQTHYHCLKCQYSVLGLSQMSAHKYRHIE